jgi:glutamate formiminotransferase / formiminotetrahydrofolate cyclodeaminase
MANPLIECIPNFSEARRPEVIAEIVAAISATADVTVLDRHSDSDHNRTVVTMIGAPAGVEEAMFKAIRKAAELINLDEHTGEHPRIGATDVVPFVPIRDMTMPECVEIARRLGKRVGEELDIPVYLYEEAAQRPGRKNLEDIRRGEYETLKKEIELVPERAPDFGPARVGPAGATVIGARQPLIAFNIYLTTDDVSIAVKVAHAVRNSSGGLRYVKAMGVLVEGRAQVSMNLTNFRQTPIHRVVEMVRREAERYGVGIHHSELVGMIPQEALVNTAVWYTQLDQFEPHQILETRMQAALSTGQTGSPAWQASFLDELARGTAAPGGGAASAFAGAAAAALAAMVSRLTTGKKKYSAVESEMWLLNERAEALRASLTTAVQEDSAAFEQFMAAMKLPKDTPEQQADRESVMQTAMAETIRVPRKVAISAVEVLELVAQVAARGNLNAISDAGSAAALARAALTGAGLNVRINCLHFNDKQAVQEFLAELDQLNTRAAVLEEEINSLLLERGGLSL